MITYNYTTSDVAVVAAMSLTFFGKSIVALG
ncbi:MAG: hypothetical protein GPOALKHO_001331 [Sodalis sp.]|nr:MAG: hypothetical protein GPOALKHO_001331 [Sodalis sp.]